MELGKRVFAVTCPAAWSNLPDNVRSAPTHDEFKQCLKTHLFNHVAAFSVIRAVANDVAIFVCKAPL